MRQMGLWEIIEGSSSGLFYMYVEPEEVLELRNKLFVEEREKLSVRFYLLKRDGRYVFVFSREKLKFPNLIIFKFRDEEELSRLISILNDEMKREIMNSVARAVHDELFDSELGLRVTELFFPFNVGTLSFRYNKGELFFKLNDEEDLMWKANEHLSLLPYFILSIFRLYPILEAEVVR